MYRRLVGPFSLTNVHKGGLKQHGFHFLPDKQGGNGQRMAMHRGGLRGEEVFVTILGKYKFNLHFTNIEFSCF
jgi:hypothetical protein